MTHGATPTNITDNVVNGTVIGDISSVYDDCSKGKKNTNINVRKERWRLVE